MEEIRRRDSHVVAERFPQFHQERLRLADVAALDVNRVRYGVARLTADERVRNRDGFRRVAQRFLERLEQCGALLPRKRRDEQLAFIVGVPADQDVANWLRDAGRRVERVDEGVYGCDAWFRNERRRQPTREHALQALNLSVATRCK